MQMIWVLTVQIRCCDQGRSHSVNKNSETVIKADLQDWAYTGGGADHVEF